MGGNRINEIIEDVDKEKLKLESEEKGDRKTVEPKTENEMVDEELGAGLYFMSVILKCKATLKLYHITDQIQSESTAEAIGKMIMSEDVKNQIIISIGYEKAIHNTDL